MIRPARILAPLGLAAALALAALPAVAEECRTVAFETVEHLVCSYDLSAFQIRLHWKDPEGRPYGSLRSFARSDIGRAARFAMNAGMYERDSTPVGLYVEDGETMRPLSTRDGPGNFHMKPNGIFFLADGRAGVLDTATFDTADLAPDFATQSGPMLVIAGKLHPRFIPGSDSIKIRNGVGVSADGRTVTFAISQARVSFDAFARLFRDELGIADALYLDGTISSVYAPEVDRADFFWPVGPIIAAYPRGSSG